MATKHNSLEKTSLLRSVAGWTFLFVLHSALLLGTEESPTTCFSKKNNNRPGVSKQCSVHRLQIKTTKADTSANPYFKKHRTLVYLNAGIFCYNLNLEHYFVFFRRSRISIRLAYGGWADWGGSGNDFILASNYVWGRKKNYFELGGGARMRIDDATMKGKWYQGKDNIYSIDYMPIFYTGYRFEALNGGAIFRLGVSTESILHISLGFRI
jgi:hypothetical protein